MEQAEINAFIQDIKSNLSTIEETAKVQAGRYDLGILTIEKSFLSGSIATNPKRNGIWTPQLRALDLLIILANADAGNKVVGMITNFQKDYPNYTLPSTPQQTMTDITSTNRYQMPVLQTVRS